MVKPHTINVSVNKLHQLCIKKNETTVCPAKAKSAEVKTAATTKPTYMQTLQAKSTREGINLNSQVMLVKMVHKNIFLSHKICPFELFKNFGHCKSAKVIN